MTLVANQCTVMHCCCWFVVSYCWFNCIKLNIWKVDFYFQLNFMSRAMNMTCSHCESMCNVILTAVDSSTVICDDGWPSYVDSMPTNANKTYSNNFIFRANILWYSTVRSRVYGVDGALSYIASTLATSSARREASQSRKINLLRRELSISSSIIDLGALI